jgi:hypothetical protein
LGLQLFLSPLPLVLQLDGTFLPLALLMSSLGKVPLALRLGKRQTALGLVKWRWIAALLGGC